jgi:import inner membrane translocase subunit TIM50
MNRDINKIIVIDWDEKAYDLQPRNALHRLKKWDGDEKDTDLVYLASFLKSLNKFQHNENLKKPNF